MIKSNIATLLFAKLESEKIDLKNKINLNSNKNNQYGQESNNLVQLQRRLDSVYGNHKATTDELKSRISKLNEKKSKIE